MTQHCHAIKRKIDRWLELTDVEKDALKEHAKGCSNCMDALAFIEPVLQALDQSAKAYTHIRYAGPLPTRPEQNAALAGSWLWAPKAGWATALAAMICIGVWFGLKSPVPRDVAERPAALGVLRMPSMPSLGRDAVSLAKSPGALGVGTPKPRHPIGPSLKPYIQIPKKPETPDRDLQKRTSMHQQHRVQTS